MSLSDPELIAKAKAGDKQAFTELFDRHRNKILSYLYAYIGDYQMAEDLTVETFFDAYKSLPRYEERGTFSAWLYKIARDYAKKEFRRRDRHKEVSMEAPIADDTDDLSLGDVLTDDKARPDFEARKDEFKEVIYKTLSKLEKKYKDVLLLCDVDGLGYVEAAKILKSNPITIGTRLRRARKMFYNILKKHGYEF